MGWRTDWLYGLVFDEARRIWKQAQKEGARSSTEPRWLPPGGLVLVQYEAADLENARCRPSVVRRWTFNGAEFEPCTSAEEPTTSPDDPAHDLKQVFYRTGAVSFFISADRKKVVRTYVLGPLYGRGDVFDVVGQGKRATLVRDGAARGWIA